MWLTIDGVIIVELLRVVLLLWLLGRILESLSVLRTPKEMVFPDVLLAGNQAIWSLSYAPCELRDRPLMRLLYLVDLRRPGWHGGDCPAPAPHGYGSLAEHVVVVVLLYLAENAALIQVFRWPRHPLDLFLLEFLAALNVDRDEVGGFVRLILDLPLLVIVVRDLHGVLRMKGG